MVLSRSGQKWSGKCMVHGLIDTIPRTKTKNITITKIRVHYFFRAVYHSKNRPCYSPPCDCCHLEQHLIYFTTLKITITCQSNSPNKTKKYQKGLLTGNLISG